MASHEELDYLWAHIKNLVVQLAVIFVDALFLSLWVFIQYVVDVLVVKQLNLSGIDKWMLLIFQGLFAVSTLVPVLASLYLDIRNILRRTREELKKGSANNRTRIDQQTGNIS